MGANGSGKSNIVDAVRWCLGEQNARDLRGQRAEDVIHAGRRRVLGTAEVSLIFEGEYEPESEIRVSRRLMRSGESDYLINGARRRLRDVQSTLSGLGMDHPRFVVVTQGMTDFLLSATAAERRALLEQAAGLSSYRQRRDEASSKLEAAEQNMVTAEVVLAELEPRIRALQRQVRAIEARDELADRLNRRQSLWYRVRRRDVRRELTEAEEGLREAELQRRDARERLDILERQAEQAIEREREWQRRVEVASAALHLAQRELDGNAHRIATTEVHIADAARARDGMRARLAQLGGEIEQAEERRRVALAAVDQARAEVSAVQAAEAASRQRSKDLLSQLETRRTSLAKVRAAAVRCGDLADTVTARLRHNEAELDELSVRIDRLGVTNRESMEELGTLRQVEEERGVDLRNATVAFESARARLEEQSGLVLRTDERLRSARHLQARLGQELRAEATAEERVKRTFAELEKLVAGTVLDRLDVARGAERAIDAALGPWRRDIPGDSRERSDFVRWREGIRPYFPAGAAWADELVTSSVNVPTILLGTIVVRDLYEAAQVWETVSGLDAHRISSPAIQVATRDGALVTAYGSQSHSTDDRGARYLAVRAELARLAGERRRLMRNDDRIRRVVGRLDQQVDLLQSGLEEANRAVAAGRARSASLEAELQGIQVRRQQLEREIEDRSAALSGAADRRRSLESALAETRQQLMRHVEDVDMARAAVQQGEAAVAEAAEALETARREVADLAADRDILAKRMGAHQDLARAAEGEVARLRHEPERLESELSSAEADIQRLIDTLGELRRESSELASAAVEREKHLAEVRVDRPQSLQEGRELRQARVASDEALARYERAAARRDEVIAAGRRLEHEIQQEMGGAKLDDGGIVDEDLPTEDEIRRLRARAAQSADYDPSIVTEYRELCERRQYLTSQIGDLKSTAAGLREIMAVADTEMKVRFAAALRRVGEEFDRVFTGMLRGGEGQLEQTADGGIEVRASLPGKRTRSSASFSGGERALVASALLFGVLRIRPAPFCVLDEVDAALDETNVDRYLEALRDLSGRMQVLVVTHNRATMTAATALYGLTMDSDGASNLLSLRLDQYDAVS